MAQKLGVRSPLKVGGHYVPAMGLGSIAVSPLDMASAYATLAAGGVYSEPTAIRKVVLPNGKEDTKAGWGSPKRTRVIPDGVAWKVTQILEDNVQLRHRRPRLLRPARGRQDRDDRQARRRLVRRLHARPRDGGLDGLSGRRDPDGERPRHRRLGRQLPGRDLAADDGADDRAAARRATSPTRRPIRVYQTFHRGPLALSYDPYYVAPTTSTDDRQHVDRHDADDDPAGQAGERQRPPRRRRNREARASRRAWPCSRSSPRPARSPGGPTRRSSLGTAATSPAPRRSSSSLLIAAFAAYLARAPRAPAHAPRHPRRDRARRRDPARAARRAAPALDRRVDVLVVRLDRSPQRRQPVLRPAGGLPGQPGDRLHGERLARHDDRLRAGVHRSPRSRSPSSPATPTPSPPGRTRRSPPLPRSRRRCSPGGSPGAARSRSRSSAGTRSSPCTSPAAGTTTPGSAP